MRIRPSFRQLQALRQQVNRLVDGLLRPPEMTVGWRPAVDLVESGHALIAQVEVPGLRPADLTVEVCGRELTIRGSKPRLEREPPPQRFHLLERFVGAFHVTVELPRPVNPGLARAFLRQGVLTVELPLLEERRNRAYTIPVEDEAMESEHA